MTQISFSDSEYTGKRKQTRREKFLAEMEQVVPREALLTVIEPKYPKAGNGRRPYALETMLRIHLASRAWAKNTAQTVTLSALSNLWMTRRTLLNTGYVCAVSEKLTGTALQMTPKAPFNALSRATSTSFARGVSADPSN